MLILRRSEYVKIVGMFTILERSDNVLMFLKIQSIWVKERIFPSATMEQICAGASWLFVVPPVSGVAQASTLGKEGDGDKQSPK